MTASRIYIVYSITGLYDSSDKCICAYTDQDTAQEHVRRAQRFANKTLRIMQLWRKSRALKKFPVPSTYLDEYGYPKYGINPYDPGMKIWDDFVQYCARELQLYVELAKQRR